MIRVEQFHGEKTINGQTLRTVLDDLEPSLFKPEIMEELFAETDSEEGLIEALKKIKSQCTPVELLMYIRQLTGISLMEATNILHRI